MNFLFCLLGFLSFALNGAQVQQRSQLQKERYEEQRKNRAKTNMGKLANDMDDYPFSKQEVNASGKRVKILRDLEPAEIQTLDRKLKSVLPLFKASQPEFCLLKNACAIVKTMKDNHIYHYQFFSSLDNEIVNTFHQYGRTYWDDHGYLDNGQLLNTFHLTTLFFNLVHLGFAPSDEFQVIMSSCIDRLMEEINLYDKQKQIPSKLYKTDHGDDRYDHIEEGLKAQEQLALIVIAYSMLDNGVNKHSKNLSVEKKAMKKMKEVIRLFSGLKINPTKHQLFYGYIKQMLYWNFLLNVDSTDSFDYLKFLSSFFKGSV